MKRLSVIFLLFCLGCTDGGLGSAGSAPLSEAECRQLLTKINEIHLADLSGSERAELDETAQEFNEGVQACVREQDWDRAGYECAMKASSTSGLDICIMKN